MNVNDELNDELSPRLKRHKAQEDGFRVPADYFDSLEDSVFRQLDALGARHHGSPFAKPARQRPGWWQLIRNLWQPRPALALAGVIALALAAWWYFQPADTATDTPALAAMISAEDAEAYLLDNIQELEPEQIALVLPAEELPAVNLEPHSIEAPADAKGNARELEVRQEDIDDLLKDMSDQELEDLINS